MNPENLTRKQILAIQADAESVGDHGMSDVCERALCGDPIALAAIAELTEAA